MEHIIEENIRLKKKLFNESIANKSREFYEKIYLEKQQQPIINTLIKEGEENRKHLLEQKEISNEVTPIVTLPEETRISISPGPVGAKYLARGEERENKISFYKLIGNQAYLKNTPIQFLGENLVILNKVYPMSDNLYRLISRKPINYEDLTIEEKEIFYDLAKTFKLFDGGKGSGGYKSKDYKIFKTIEEELKPVEPVVETVVEPEEEYSGDGLTEIIKRGTTYLLNRLKLLLASKQAGNNGVINEISDILKYLYETNKISKNKFKSLTQKLI